MANETVIDDLKEMIINWLALDDKIKEISATVKDMNLEKKQFESYILDYMTKLNKPAIDTTSGKLIKEEKKSYKESKKGKTKRKQRKNEIIKKKKKKNI